MSKTRKPVLEGWFTEGDEPRLLGTQCQACRTYFFPKLESFCRNPDCSSSDLAEIPLSRRGKLWSFTNNCYAPPAPYVSPDPFVPYAIAAVELEEEKMVVLGQVVPGVGHFTMLEAPDAVNRHIEAMLKRIDAARRSL